MMPQRINIPGMGVVEFPDGMSDDQIGAAIKKNMPGAAKTVGTSGATADPSSLSDFAKSIPRGMVGGLSQVGSTMGQAAMHEMGQPEGAAQIPNAEGMTQAIEQNVTGQMHRPEGTPGKFGAAIGEALGNPVSYLGPGSLPLKLGGAALAATGSEAAGQATEGTKYEGAARMLGGLAGGVTAAKTLAPAAERAVIPGGRELKDIAGKGYDAALNSGLELHPLGPAVWAGNVEQKLSGAGFTGGKYGTAPKTMAVLGELQNPPTNASVGASNIDAIRKTLGNIAQEVNPSNGGALKPTADANAATRALDHLRTYTENIPQSHIVAGDASEYARQIKQANANYAAGSRTQDFDARLTKAENATDRQVSGSLDSQIKSKAGQMLDNPQRMRGMNEAERAQLGLINSGSATSNILRQLGRGGAGVIPIGAHVAAAMATGGASVPASLAIGMPLYGARKIAESMTKGRASDLVDMLAKRSPEYQRRAAAIPQFDNSPHKAAILRALIQGAQ